MLFQGRHLSSAVLDKVCRSGHTFLQFVEGVEAAYPQYPWTLKQLEALAQVCEQRNFGSNFHMDL